jgi:hypothetical protein
MPKLGMGEAHSLSSVSREKPHSLFQSEFSRQSDLVLPLSNSCNRSALFWDITQHRVTILYRRVGGKNGGPLEGGRGARRGLPGWWGRFFVPKRRYGIRALFCIIYQKSADLIYTAAEA